MRGHTSGVEGVAFFNDGRRVVTGSWDKTLRIWNVRTLLGEPLQGHQGHVFSVAVSPDSRQIASGGQDSTVIIWDVERKQIVFKLVKHEGWVNCVRFSPDGKRLASGSNDGTAVIWDTKTGTALTTLIGGDGVLSVAFSPDGLKLASATSDGIIRVCSTDNANLLLLEFVAHGHLVRGIVWSPNGQQLISASSDNTVKFWNFSTGRQIGQPCTGHTNLICSLAIASDGSFIATASYDKTVRLWSTKSYQQIGQPLEHSNTVRCVAISTNGALLASVTGNEDLYLWSIGNAPKRQDRQEGYKEELEVEQQPGISEIQVLPTLPVKSHSSVPAEVILQDLTALITRVGDFPVARGGFGEVWKCIYQTDRGPTDVAVKSLLVYASDQNGEGMKKKTKRIKRELKTCARLNHPNILPVYGYTRGFGLLVAIVCPWAKKGNLTMYLEDEGATLTFVRRFEVLRDVASGLQYLHANNIIHGDLNGPNVLIHGDGTACLADFGLSLVYSEVITKSAASWTSSFHGNFRWMAPELLGHSDDDVPVRPSKHSDIYSFGGVMLQVLTSKVPYYYQPGDAAVAVCIYTGVKPSRSRYPEVSDKYWGFIEECWSAKPLDRPSADRVVEVIMDELFLFLH